MDYLSLNRKAWEERAIAHFDSTFYDVNSFLAGKSSLNTIECELLGSVSEQSILHLQCHFGLDSLSLARLGAKVTGVDFSQEAIRRANTLAQQTKLDATFICQDIEKFGSTNTDKFNIVFASYGTICWLHDLSSWATTIANALKPGGQFCFVEFHPSIDLNMGYSYFAKQQPDVTTEATYTENQQSDTQTIATWPHSIGEVLTALMQAGLTITHFDEHPFSPYNCFDGLEAVPGHGFQLLHKGQQVPLLFSVMAKKHANE
ncbi:class I SAM-dependent methyltransferase [Pseudoalteromonas sp. McH1-7]|uniref:class I SAM-dependent methyltransferase n=1 Tax=unclassified Pseudoalteromonas TaxID=194690 RepID=UPI000F6504E6|nr:MULTISPECIES: class I SAM-dependent methyltransferase [unclassified Pseudoalteromonas]NUZ12849.1 class I SAM-dependent methyltransferase [Pseudoalteromonas sp. McH1-7]RRS08431.1 class I SAM-dependent methyltransferase [Pseudoalteromonas sp. J010]